MATVSRIPAGMHTVTPYLTIRDCAAAIEFYKRAFGAKELMRMPAPDGKRIMHGRIQIGDSVLMLNDEFPEWGSTSPLALNGTPMTLHIYVQDADKAFAQAVAAGATVKMELMDTFWGDRYGQVTDPYGYKWSIAHHAKDVSPEEMKRLMAETMCKSEKK
jgi:PhnB protein